MGHSPKVFSTIGELIADVLNWKLARRLLLLLRWRTFISVLFLTFICLRGRNP